MTADSSPVTFAGLVGVVPQVGPGGLGLELGPSGAQLVDAQVLLRLLEPTAKGLDVVADVSHRPPILARPHAVAAIRPKWAGNPTSARHRPNPLRVRFRSGLGIRRPRVTNPTHFDRGLRPDSTAMNGTGDWVLHVDLDQFLAAVEVLRRPELAGPAGRRRRRREPGTAPAGGGDRVLRGPGPRRALGHAAADRRPPLPGRRVPPERQAGVRGRVGPGGRHAPDPPGRGRGDRLGRMVPRRHDRRPRGARPRGDRAGAVRDPPDLRDRGRSVPPAGQDGHRLRQGRRRPDEPDAASPSSGPTSGCP